MPILNYTTTIEALVLSYSWYLGFLFTILAIGLGVGLIISHIIDLVKWIYRKIKHIPNKPTPIEQLSIEMTYRFDVLTKAITDLVNEIRLDREQRQNERFDGGE